MPQSKEQYEAEHQVVESWRPPTDETIETKRRVLDIELWIQHRGWVEEAEVIRFATRRFNISEKQAKRYLKMVVADFQRVGVPVIGA